MKKSKLILTLFLSFFKIGAFTFGGGYAMLSLLENEFVEKKGWLTKEEFLDMVAIRLNRQGSKDRPFYKIVVVDSRARRDGDFIEQVGTYNPMAEGENYTLDLEKVEKWISNGAQPSETVASMIKKARAAKA